MGNTSSTDAVEPVEPEFEPITTQADFDKRLGARLAREQKKFTDQYSDYEALKEKADKYDQLQTESLSEVEKAVQRAEAAEKAAAELQLDNLRRDVAMSKGVPVNLIAGADKAAMEAAADAAIAFRDESAVDATRAPKPDLTQGQVQADEVPTGDWFRDQFMNR